MVQPPRHQICRFQRFSTAISLSLTFKCLITAIVVADIIVYSERMHRSARHLLPSPHVVTVFPLLPFFFLFAFLVRSWGYLISVLVHHSRLDGRYLAFHHITFHPSIVFFLPWAPHSDRVPRCSAPNPPRASSSSRSAHRVSSLMSTPRSNREENHKNARWYTMIGRSSP